MALSRLLKTVGKIMKSSAKTPVTRNEAMSAAKLVIKAHKKELTNVIGTKMSSARNAILKHAGQFKEIGWAGKDTGFYGHALVSGHPVDKFYNNVSNPIKKGKC